MITFNLREFLISMASLCLLVLGIAMFTSGHPLIGVVNLAAFVATVRMR